MRTDGRSRLFNYIESALEISLPNISSIDYTERQLQARRNDSQNLAELFRRPDQIHVERGYRKTEGGREIRRKVFKIGSDKNAETTGNLGERSYAEVNA